MEEFDLGPNGGLMYCMEYLVEHIDLLVEKIEALDENYIFFDCPGQVKIEFCYFFLVEAFIIV